MSLRNFFFLLRPPNTNNISHHPHQHKQHGHRDGRMAANGQQGDQKEEKSSPRTFLICAKSHGSLHSVGTWTSEGGYASWCHDLLCSPLLAAASDERRLERFSVLNGVPLMRHVELGIGTMLEARASKPASPQRGPTVLGHIRDLI
ncbi:hypothetical protein V8C42DRAFT_96155 [Trichoderma barbatum]